jgi:hypothetical protein
MNPLNTNMMIQLKLMSLIEDEENSELNESLTQIMNNKELSKEFTDFIKKRKSGAADNKANSIGS